MTQQLPSDLRWIGFDLDDTLHYFKRASGKAAEAVFSQIERQFGLDTENLAQKYRGILQAAQSSHFSQPKSSRQYRSERFAALLAEFGVDPGPRLDCLLDTYDTALGESLELKPGADQALRAAKRGGLSVMVISEGPHDAQQTTIERLGIALWVDLLVTSGSEGTSKSHDLFGRALARAGCDPAEIVFVGDSLERDVGPASALGITCFYVGEERLPEGSAAVKLGLTTLSELIERIAPPYDESVR